MKRRLLPLSEPSLEEREALRRKREIIAAVVIAVVLAALFVVEAFFFDFRGTIGTANLLFFTLINVNIILACLLLFLILRNLTKLLFERRRRVLGARLRTRLVVAFAAFALIPTILLFYVAMTFISNSIERWFTLQIESSLNESMEVAQKFYEVATARAIQNATQIAIALVEEPDFKTWLKPASSKEQTVAAEQLKLYLTDKRQQLSVDLIELYPTPTSKPLGIRNPGVTSKRWPKLSHEALQKAFDKAATSSIDGAGKSELARGLAPIIDADGQVLAVAAVGFMIQENLVEKMRHIQTAYEEYRKLRLFETPIRTSYLIILSLISLFIFFAATWFGFYLARQITDPLQRLAEGARQVAEGEMDLRFQKVADDEIGTLVEAFNKMLDDLAVSRQALELAMTNLEATNIELEQRRASMEAILENVAAGVLSFDNDGRVLTVNPSIERILGIKAAEALTKTWTDVFPPEVSNTFKKLGDELYQGKKWTVQNQFEIAVGGDTRTLLAILSVIRSGPGDPAGAVLVVEDLTELLKAQRVAAWQEIARRIAHEIKNPLTPIQLAAQRLQKRYQDRLDAETDKVFFDSTEIIIRQVEEMKRMVKEFSDFARMAEAKPTECAIGDIVKEAVILYREAHRHIEFTVQIDAAVPTLLLDRDQIKRALINVIDNAVASIEGPGAVEVQARLGQNARAVVIGITDTGRGLPKAYRSRLFEPYFSTKKMGTGLGLAIVHRIVTDHGGRITLRDNHPHGTVVTIELPIRHLEEPAEPPEPAPPA